MSMDNNQTPKRAHWSSNIGFILAAAGSAVGLGNLWKFPYLVGQNGGSVFILVYCFFALFFGVSLILTEISIGRATQLNPIDAFNQISPKMTWVGIMVVATSVLILSYYSVVGGWILFYLYKSLVSFGADADYVKVFSEFTSSANLQLITFIIYFAINYGILALGVQKGIEKFSKIMMPALFIILLVIVVRTLTLDGAMEGVKFLLQPDFSKLSAKTVLMAMGQVFYSLSLGMGIMITYGSYMKKEDNMIASATSIPIIDTAVALLAAIAIMPAVFAFKMEPTAGPGLMFNTLPAIFSQIPFGQFFAFIFFILLFFAALTSSISLLESSIALLIDKWHFKRSKAVAISSAIPFLLGIPSALSFSILKDTTFFGKSFFDAMDFLTSSIMLPIGGIMTCIAVGWIWDKGIKSINIKTKLADGSETISNSYTFNAPLKEITNHGKVEFSFLSAWIFLIKWVCPLGILAIFLDNL